MPRPVSPPPARTIYVPAINALGALGKKEALRNVVQQNMQVLEAHLRKLPEDARAHALLANDYTQMGRREEAVREANLAIALRPNDVVVLFNVACTFGQLDRKPECLGALRKAWEAGFKDPAWARRDSALALLHGDPEFERLYPASPQGA